MVSQLGLAAITGGFKAAVFSGEMTASRVREWVLLQAAGPNNVMPDPIAANHYCLKPGIERKLDMLLKGKLAIYDNSFGTNCEEVLKTIYEWVKAEQTEVVIIDNLMALDFPMATAADKYDMQSRTVKLFSAMAKELNVHIHFICHPRKQRVSFVKGTSAAPQTSQISRTMCSWFIASMSTSWDAIRRFILNWKFHAMSAPLWR